MPPSDSDRRQRLQRRLTGLAAKLRDPGTAASAHDVPDFVFVYDPQDELILRDCLPGFVRALSEVGRRAEMISLADEMWAILREGGWTDRLAQVDARNDPVAANDTVARVLAARDKGLEARVLRRIMPPALDPKQDIAVLYRTGALFPVYRTSSLMQRLEGLTVPVVLCYPGVLEPPYGLRFMGQLPPDPRYRATILADDGRSGA